MATLKLNGSDVSLPDDPRTTLLDFLHQHLSLFGTKKGCDHGQCGACTVLVDGERVNACLVFAFQLVSTIRMRSPFFLKYGPSFGQSCPIVQFNRGVSLWIDVE